MSVSVVQNTVLREETREVCKKEDVFSHSHNNSRVSTYVKKGESIMGSDDDDDDHDDDNKKSADEYRSRKDLDGRIWRNLKTRAKGKREISRECECVFQSERKVKVKDSEVNSFDVSSYLGAYFCCTGRYNV